MRLPDMWNWAKKARVRLRDFSGLSWIGPMDGGMPFGTAQVQRSKVWGVWRSYFLKLSMSCVLSNGRYTEGKIFT
jgi:hypothetical protein